MPPPQQRITIQPANPVQGGTVRICYEFAGSGLTQTRLSVSFSPNNQVSEHLVTETDPCVDVNVPGDATSILIHDVDGSSVDKAAAVKLQ